MDNARHTRLCAAANGDCGARDCRTRWHTAEPRDRHIGCTLSDEFLVRIKWPATHGSACGAGHEAFDRCEDGDGDAGRTYITQRIPRDIAELEVLCLQYGVRQITDSVDGECQ